MSKKLCPLMSRIFYDQRAVEGFLHPVPCMEHECELWTHVHVTPFEEGGVHTVMGCAFRIGATTNSEGKVPI